MTNIVSLGRRIHDLAQEEPDRAALIFVPLKGSATTFTRRELDEASTRVAHRLIEAGIDVGDLVGIGLRNSPEHVIASLGVWKAGGSVLTMRWDVPDWERDRLVEAAQPKLIISDRDAEATGGVPIIDVASADDHPTDPLDERVPKFAVAVPSGGSTGVSKAIVPPIPGALPAGMALAGNRVLFGLEPFERHIVFAPLYHGNPFLMVHGGLFDGQTIILHEKFRAEQVIESIETYRPEFMTLAPTMMKRLLEADGIDDVDWSCFAMILHGTAPTPEWLKRRFIDLVGAERLWEIFASSELTGSIIVRGDEWLEHPGTVGRPAPNTDLRIVGPDGEDVAPGEVGEIYMRIKGTEAPVFNYLGADQPKVLEGGYASAGDLGYVDEDGYIFSADRRTDLIISGGANIVPAEVEAALSEHEAVRDVAVIGLPDDEWGQRAHAVVEPADRDAPPSTDELEQHCRERLAAYKVPKSFEIVDELPRSEAFKIRRSALVDSRS